MRYGTLSRQLSRLAGPILVETFLIMALGAVDTFMLSRHSDNSVAAVAFGGGLVALWCALFLDENIRGIIFIHRWKNKRWTTKGFIK